MKYCQGTEEEEIGGLRRMLGSIPKTCVEFGATDGIWLSNTAHLWREQMWEALLIEPDDGNFENLRRNTEDEIFDCTISHKLVEPSGASSIDAIIAESNFATDIGVMSIDVDGEDYRIFEGMKAKPWIVLIEFNATIPPGAEVVGLPGSRLGCSATSLAILAGRKNYAVWAISGSNIILVRRDLVSSDDIASRLELTGLAKVSVCDTVYTNKRMVGKFFQDHSLSYVIQDYNGDWCLYREPVFGMRNPIQIPGVEFWSPGRGK